MKQVILKKGQAVLQDIPAPTVQPGQVLVEVAYSLISAGTERAALNRSGLNLVQRALAQRERVQQVVDYARNRGVSTAVSMVRAKLGAGSKPGYSCAGQVLAVGAGVDNFQPGDRVACAGSGIAYHAEIVTVPKNLVVHVPEECSLRDAASTTVGSIALQGVRRANCRLGETVAVIGLGLLGQLTLQMLKASGCQVVGIDMDANRVAPAKTLGADLAFTPGDGNLEAVRHLTHGQGADATIITAASKSDEIVQQAMKLTRRKGRVVIVGDVGLGVQRSPFYEKEIDLLISTSYGPGRYDPVYEEKGQDYPYAYVRWTENRNMQAYLRLLETGQVRLDSILTAEYPLAQAEAAFAALQNDETRPLGVLLAYPPAKTEADKQQKLASRTTFRAGGTNTGKLNVAVIGAGGFARGMHLPALNGMADVQVRAVVAGRGTNAVEIGQQFGVDYVSTRYQDVLADDTIDMVVISTRHHLHAEMTIAAARAGKAIFLEKPMALNEDELGQILQVLEKTNVPFMVGFNRRFSPAVKQIHRQTSQRGNPLVALYRVNAGLLPPSHWIHTHEGGGRIIGEACHMLDTFRYLTGSPVVKVSTRAITPHSDYVLPTDNFSATLKYADGSLCSLVYTALGAKALSKEYIELHCDSTSYIVDDFRKLRVANGQGSRRDGQDKGHKAEMAAFIQYVRQGGEAPISLDELVEVTRTSFQLHAQIGSEFVDEL